MSARTKNKIVIVVSMTWLVVFFLLCLQKPADTFSYSERRKLTQFPQISMEDIRTGNFMQDFEEYAVDQFPLRAVFRDAKGLFSSFFMGKLDDNGVYVWNGYASQMDYPLKKEAVINSGERCRYVYEKYLDQTDTNVYVSVIPDKNYFMADESGHLSFDYPELIRTFLKEVDFAKYLDITELLSLDDYYQTDTHWRQECIVDVAEKLLEDMGAKSVGEYREQELDAPFYGVYYGQSALILPPDKLNYLMSDILSECKVYDYENEREIAVYDLEKGHGRDSYELFLSGNLSLLTIENPNADTEKELVVFRDSFGSSLAPLLAEGYHKITLVDIRYLPLERIEKYIQFKEQDVLFLYSTLVLNNEG